MFSDGAWLGFYEGGRLRRVPVEGGDPVTLWEDASDAQGSVWVDNGAIIFTYRLLEGLRMISAGGGKPRNLTELREQEGERSHLWPHLLPDGDSLLFTVWRGGGIDRCDIDVVSLESGERRRLLRGGSHPR